MPMDFIYGIRWKNADGDRSYSIRLSKEEKSLRSLVVRFSPLEITFVCRRNCGRQFTF